MIRILFSLIILFVLHTPLFALEKKHHMISYTGDKVKVDGYLDENCWNNALILSLPYEVDPGENIKAPVETDVLLAYSKTHLYVAFRAYDPDPAKIRGKFRDRDDIWDDDVVGVVLDTYNDERRAFDFFCNPLGMQEDAVESMSNYDVSWDAIWESAGRIDREGYVVEMSIPFSSLRFQRTEGIQTWGFDAIRSYPRGKRHHIAAFKRDRNNNCYLCQSLKISGFEGATPGKNVELVPTATLQLRKSKMEDTGDFDWQSKKPELGLTAKWGITPNLTLGGILNPDFSQVEADALQMDINEPFALYYQEKRPFFTEGADFFNTPVNAVYTRSIRDPLWGVKLTGKEGTHTLASYFVQDQLTNLILPGSQESNEVSLDMKSYNGSFRYKKEFGNKYSVGTLITQREGRQYHNRLYSLDANLRLSEQDRLSLQMGGSSTEYPDTLVAEYDQPEGSFSDMFINAWYSHKSRNIRWEASYENLGSGFRADQGFVPMVNFIRYSAGSNYRWSNNDSKSWWSSMILGTDYSYTSEQDNDHLSNNLDIWFEFTGIKQSHFTARFSNGSESYNHTRYPLKRISLHTCMKPAGNLHYYINLNGGGQIDYRNSRPGNNLRFVPGFVLDLGLHVHTGLEYTREKMNVASGELYRVNMMAGRMVYQFSKRMFVRGIIQYREYNRNVDLYDPEDPPNDKDEIFITQFLFSYKVNPQTVFFLGYTDDYSGHINSRFSEEVSFSDNRKNWSVFFKLGYAIVPK